VSATARPNRLFSATGAAGGAAIPDPTSNLTKINSISPGTARRNFRHRWVPDQSHLRVQLMPSRLMASGRMRTSA
jgi:hypothetical protein